MSDVRLHLWTSDWRDAPRPARPGRLLYAIGDLHGRADLLEPLLAVLRRRVRESGREALVVYIGDYVDRGPEAGRVLDLVAGGLGERSATEVALVGNHDAVLLEILRSPDPGPELIDAWLRMNAVPTLLDLGFEESEIGADPERFRERLAATLGPRRLEFLNGLRIAYRAGPYLFVHAGIDPEADLGATNPMALISIREPFLSHSGPWRHPFTVVHGHTPMQPMVLPHRIGIDTGAAFSGALSAVEIDGARVRFLTVTDREDETWREGLPGDPENVSYGAPAPL